MARNLVILTPILTLMMIQKDSVTQSQFFLPSFITLKVQARNVISNIIALPMSKASDKFNHAIYNTSKVSVNVNLN